MLNWEPLSIQFLPILVHIQKNPETFNIHAPFVQKQIKGKRCPWLTREVRQKLKGRDQILRKARKCGRKEDWDNYKRKRNQSTHLVRQVKNNYHQQLLNEK